MFRQLGVIQLGGFCQQLFVQFFYEWEFYAFDFNVTVQLWMGVQVRSFCLLFYRLCCELYLQVIYIFGYRYLLYSFLFFSFFLQFYRVFMISYFRRKGFEFSLYVVLFDMTELVRRIVLQDYSLVVGWQRKIEWGREVFSGVSFELCIWEFILLEGEVVGSVDLRGLAGSSQFQKASFVKAGVLGLCFVYRFIYI